MAKDKLITVRIEGDKREAFKKWTDSKGLEVSAFLYDVIDACLGDRIDEKIISGKRIDKEEVKRIDNRLNKIDIRLDTMAEQIDKQIDNKLVKITQRLLEKIPQQIDSNIDKRLDKSSADINKLHTHFGTLSDRFAHLLEQVKPLLEESEKEQQPDSGLTDLELSKRLGCSERSVYRWRTGETSPGAKYASVMQQWEVKDERWYTKT